ncbi:MAG TPA: DUF6364 family protein [Fimbriimonadaceae bacterium]|jgi:hypothetical protein
MTKKTTLTFDESIYMKIRERAARKGESMSSVVAEALIEYFASKPSSKKRVESFTVGTGDWIAPADPGSNREMLDYLDAFERGDKKIDPTGRQYSDSSSQTGIATARGNT